MNSLNSNDIIHEADIVAYTSIPVEVTTVWKQSNVLFVTRIATLMLLAVFLTLHLWSTKVFRWENTASGGLIITYLIIFLGLTICTGTTACDACMFQTFVNTVGGCLFLTNAFVMAYRWYESEDMRLLAELLLTVGMRLGLQVGIKISLSVSIAVLLVAHVVLSTTLKNSFSQLHTVDEYHTLL